MARHIVFISLVSAALVGCNGDDGTVQDCKDDSKVDAYVDADGDGYGAGAVERVCELVGYATNDLDCNDGDAAISPDTAEACNGLDDNCNEVADDGLETSVWFADGDQDGYGDSSVAELYCQPPGGESWSQLGNDCDDTDAARSPGEQEVCDAGIDNDCDGAADDDDDNVDPKSFGDWFSDEDGDGFGRPSPAPYRGCTGPAGSVDNDLDCADGNPDVNPDATEICDGGDNDCDGMRDDEDPSLDLATQQTLYADTDADGFGDPFAFVMACTQTVGVGVVNSDDCDDTSNVVNPGRNETLCDSLDNDCDALTTDDRDGDLDGVLACSGDCDDTDPEVLPGATELPADLVDQDCDAMELCYQDVDGDGGRTSGAVLVSDLLCNMAPNVRASRPIDCDDTDPLLTLSGQWERDFDLDGFGDGVIDLEQCGDPGPGYVLTGGIVDCDDSTAAAFPGNTEDACNDEVDADCNGLDSCLSCGDWLSTDPSLTTGVYPVRPGGTTGNVEVDVYCDMDLDGGGWTLVASSTGPLVDVGGAPYGDLATLTPTAGHPNPWDGLRTLLVGNTDVRFACKLDPADPAFTVDLTFYDVDWYEQIALANTEAQSCVSETASPDQPARRNNLVAGPSGFRDATDPFDGTGAGIEVEDSCGDAGDFTVDFDDGGMDQDKADGTDWGLEDSKEKCGVADQGGAWFLFVRL